jgi:hypothetical protein
VSGNFYRRSAVMSKCLALGCASRFLRICCNVSEAGWPIRQHAAGDGGFQLKSHIFVVMKVRLNLRPFEGTTLEVDPFVRQPEPRLKV